jgi:hypothetical protein
MVVRFNQSSMTTTSCEVRKMDNQHRKITGYGELTQYEIDVMNAIKQLGAAMAEQIENVSVGIAAQRKAAARQNAEARAQSIATTGEEGSMTSNEQHRLDAAQPERWIAIARTHFQEGLMALTRAVAQPGSF